MINMQVLCIACAVISGISAIVCGILLAKYKHLKQRYEKTKCEG